MINLKHILKKGSDEKTTNYGINYKKYKLIDKGKGLITKATQKAYYIIGYGWVPKSWVRIESQYTYDLIYVKNWFYDKMMLKYIDWELKNIDNTIKEIKREIKESKEEYYNDEFSDMTKDDLDNILKHRYKDLQEMEKRKKYFTKKKKELLEKDKKNYEVGKEKI